MTIVNYFPVVGNIAGQARGGCHPQMASGNISNYGEIISRVTSTSVTIHITIIIYIKKTAKNLFNVV